MDLLISRLLQDYQQGRDIDRVVPVCYPRQTAVQSLLDQLRILLFPGYFREDPGCTEPDTYLALVLMRAHFALEYLLTPLVEAKAGEICQAFFGALPSLRQLMQLDLESFLEADPAAAGKEEIILSYPGYYAIWVYRLAHALHGLGVPMLPRMMTELAHSQTGIDIHPGAQIAGHFFIDHGTGVVIGETTEIAEYVQIYQGVTLGAISTRGGQALKHKKRHPTLCSHVTVYAGASILGGDTVIGEGAVIGANAFITASVPGKTMSS